MNKYESFKSIASEVVRSGKTEKAKEFAQSVILKIEAKGAEWIESNFSKLGLIEGGAPAIEDISPVADNRIFYIQKWQMALI